MPPKSPLHSPVGVGAFSNIYLILFFICKGNMKAEGPFKVLERPEGRAMVCTTDAKPGDLVLDEEAFVVSPETSFLMNKYVSLFLFCFLLYISPKKQKRIN